MNRFIQAIKDATDARISQIQTSMPGKVTAAVCENGRWIVSAQPVIPLKTPDGRVLDAPVIAGIPVAFPSGDGGSASVTFPIKVGDGVLLSFSSRQIDDWMTGGDSQDPRRFDLTDAMAIPGLSNASVNGAAVDPTALCLAYGGAVMKIPKDGPIESNVDIVIEGISFKSHVHSGVIPGGGDTGPPVG